jgi:hypothetical protein
MTLTPTDRGIAFIKDNPDGTKNVYVALGVTGNAPQDVVAMHLDRKTVSIAPEVGTVSAGPMRRTTENVHVSSDANGVVYVRSHRRDMGPLLTA